MIRSNSHTTSECKNKWIKKKQKKNVLRVSPKFSSVAGKKKKSVEWTAAIILIVN